MGIIELLLLSIGLAMDAFAVSVCQGVSLRKLKWKDALICGIYFGGFQAGMPWAGYVLGIQFQQVIAAVDHWIAFGLLSVIGINMIREARSDEEVNEKEKDGLPPMQVLLMLAIATSIDALAVGVTLGFMDVHIVPATTLIGVVTFFLSTLGVKIGFSFGTACKSKAEIIGGIVLIGIGLKILLF